MNIREIAIFVPLILLTLWMGIYPTPFLEIMDASVANLINQYQSALTALDNVSILGR